ncbi:MAG: Xaa-Pro peptidase family protein [Fibrobacterales bacterium]
MTIKQLQQKYSQVFVAGLKGDSAVEAFRDRRKRQLKELKGVSFFFSASHEPHHDTVHLMNATRLFQEPSILYLTGINQQGIVLMLDPQGRSESEILFVAPKDPTKEFWDGVRIGIIDKVSPKKSIQDIVDLVGITKVKPLSDLDSWIKEKARKTDVFYAFHHTYLNKKRITRREDQNSGQVKALKKAIRSVNKGAVIESCAAEHFAVRNVHDQWQVKESKRAQKLTRDAYLAFLPRLPALKSEHEVRLGLEGLLQEKSIYGLSFPTIVASGQNACVLHYQKCDAPLDKKGMLLLDFGVRFGTLHSDISRTIPANGKFNPLQKLLYEIVLEAQSVNEALIKPGAIIQDNDWKVWSFIEKELNSQFFAKGGIAKREYTTKPHGVSHLIGEQCHEGDPFRLYQVEPLREGMLLSNEPGLYGYFEMKIDGRLYKEYIGIRIEDDIYVTKNGCDNLSKSIPKTVDEIESLMKKV